MPNLADLEHEFLNHAIEQMHPFVRVCAGERLCDNLLEEIRTDLDRITNRDFAQWHGSGREFFGEPIVRFNNHLVQFGPIRMIVGIRFLNCRQEGLTFEVLVDDVWSGIVAGRLTTIGGVKGIQVVEIVLEKGMQGFGLGVAVQRRFAEAVMTRNPSAVIWGTVADINLPMRRTAERVGRVDVGAYHWADLQAR